MARAVEDFTHEDGELASQLGTLERDDYKRQFFCVSRAKEALALAERSLRMHEREHQCAPKEPAETEAGIQGADLFTATQ